MSKVGMVVVVRWVRYLMASVGSNSKPDTMAPHRWSTLLLENGIDLGIVSAGRKRIAVPIMGHHSSYKILGRWIGGSDVHMNVQFVL